MDNSEQHALFVIFQAEPLVIDLKDLFQVIFNMRKKEAEASQKVTVAQGTLEAFQLKQENASFMTFGQRRCN